MLRQVTAKILEEPWTPTRILDWLTYNLARNDQTRAQHYEARGHTPPARRWEPGWVPL